VTLEVLREHPVGAFCGIGNPEAFRQTLLGLGARPGAFRTYADHHTYSREDVADLCAWGRSLPPDALLVTTQKDLVKLRVTQLGEKPLWALRIRLELATGQDELEHKLVEVLAPP
jgi:tetraacyldisaccharide 4'-kinase